MFEKTVTFFMDVQLERFGIVMEALVTTTIISAVVLIAFSAAIGGLIGYWLYKQEVKERWSK